MTQNYFGTDGVRGRVGEGLLTPEHILKLGWSIGSVLKACHSNEVLIGKDTRISGYMLESALESGLAAAGMNVALLGPMPTPAISYLTTTYRCAAGIVISASHNPYYDNGIKLFGQNGQKPSVDLEIRISEHMQRPITVVEPEHIGKARRISGAPDRYIEFCKSKFIDTRSLQGMRIVLDCAHGATYHIAEAVFSELGAKTITLANQPDGFNINDNCGSTALNTIQSAVKEYQADLGIAFDGDGDRAIMINAHGDIVDGDDMLYIIAKHAKYRNKLVGTGIVGTVMTNLGIEHALSQENIPFARSAVGDKHVVAKLNTLGWFIGGEPSGHIINTHKTISGDGIISAILVLNALIDHDTDLTHFLQPVEKIPYRLSAITCNTPHEVMQNKTIQRLIKDIETKLGNDGRVLVRASGTEPKIRIMLEGSDSNLLQKLEAEITEGILNSN